MRQPHSTYRIPQETRAQLAALAADQGTSETAVICELVDAAEKRRARRLGIEPLPGGRPANPGRPRKSPQTDPAA